MLTTSNSGTAGDEITFFLVLRRNSMWNRVENSETDITRRTPITTYILLLLGIDSLGIDSV
jgi:hypothetical protein